MFQSIRLKLSLSLGTHPPKSRWCPFPPSHGTEFQNCALSALTGSWVRIHQGCDQGHLLSQCLHLWFLAWNDRRGAAAFLCAKSGPLESLMAFLTLIVCRHLPPSWSTLGMIPKALPCLWLSASGGCCCFFLGYCYAQSKSDQHCCSHPSRFVINRPHGRCPPLCRDTWVGVQCATHPGKRRRHGQIYVRVRYSL